MSSLALRLALLACGASALAACSSDTPPADAGTADVPVVTDNGPPVDTGPAPATCTGEGGAACFELPTAVLRADVDGGVADFNCMAPAETRATAAFMVSGRVRDFQSGTPVANATVALFGDDSFEGAPLATGMTDVMGNYTLMAPMNTPNVVNWRVRANETLDTYSVRETLNVAGMAVTGENRESVAASTGRALPALIGMQRREMTGIIAGEARDCRGRSLENAIVTLASASSPDSMTAPSFVPGAQVYYFNNDLPTQRRTRISTNTDGLFVLLQVPPPQGTTRYYVQVWGFRDMAALGMGRAGLSLLAETPVRVLPDAVVIANLPPRGP
jgi:hypothetical protein